MFVVRHRSPEGWDARHDPSLTTFVRDGVASALDQAQAVAEEKWVGVAGPNIAQQCLDLGLLDQIRVELVPVLLGDGVPFFANLKTSRLCSRTPRSSRATG